MIKIADQNDLAVVNDFLKEFDLKVSLDSFLTHPFSKYVLLIEDEPIGFLNYSLVYDRIEINYIFINKNNRGLGHASKLLHFLDEEVLKNNITSISLEVSVNNKAAISLYEKHGFQVVAVRKNYYPDSDGLLMTKGGEV